MVEPSAKRAVVVMGVSGSGKTTMGQALAQGLGWAFVDADDLHPAANRSKMAGGQPLSDADRAPWLDQVAACIAGAGAGTGVVVACSALKRAYRERLRVADPALAFVYLNPPAAVLAERLARRRGHFMPPALLDSQLATLEPPGADEAPITVPSDLGMTDQVEAVLRALRS